MPPKGHDTPPASPCRDLVLALSVASVDQQQHHQQQQQQQQHHRDDHGEETSGGSRTTASADAGGRIIRSDSAAPRNAGSSAAVASNGHNNNNNNNNNGSILTGPIAAGRSRRDRIRRRRHRVSPSFADDNDGLGEEEIFVGHSHHQPQPPRPHGTAAAAAAGHHASGLEMEGGATRPNAGTGTIDDGDDGDDEDDDNDGEDGNDRKPCANAGAAAAAASQSPMSKKRPTPPLPTPATISGLPPHFVSPPPSAQCAKPRRSSIRRPSVVSPDADSCADPSPSIEEKPKMRRNNLSFHSVEVREYSQVLGDHPCCQSGLPLSLGWDYDADATTIHDVDEYETHRKSQRVKSRKDMKLDCEERRVILSSVKQRVATETAADGGVLATEETTAYTSMDLRRAERRLYRERRVSTRKMDSFFGSASGIGGVADGGADSRNGADHQPAQSASATNAAPMSGKQRRRSFFTTSSALEENTGISPHHE